MKKTVSFVICVMLLCIFGITASAEDYIVKLKAGENSELVCMDELSPVAPELDLYKTDDISAAEAYEYVEEDAPVELFDTYDYSEYLSSGTYSSVGMGEMWDSGIAGNGVRIAVIDSGCSGRDLLSASVENGVSVIENITDMTDNIGHGTSVCGAIGTEYGTNGCIGTARNADIIPIKFIDKVEGVSYGGTTSYIIKGIMSAVDDYGCRVINLSCGTAASQALSEAIAYAEENGAVVTAAVGNDGKGSNYALKRYPAAYDTVIGVGSVNGETKEYSAFSNRNDTVFVTAPGELVSLPKADGSVGTRSGTSFSAPYVAGIAADILCINPELTPAEVRSVLAKCTEDLGDEGYDTEYGNGLVRADKILEYMLAGCDYFVSDTNICTVDNFAEVRVRINESASVPVLILAEYSDSLLTDVTTHTEKISDTVEILRVPATDENTYRLYVWDSAETMKPLEFNTGIAP